MGNCCSFPKTVDEEPEEPNSPVLQPALDGKLDLESHEYVEYLGQGISGSVHLYRVLATGENVAIKSMVRPVPQAEHVCCEIQIQAKLGEDHVNIIEARTALLTNHYLAVEMEAADGGNLTNYISTDARYQHAVATELFMMEDEARYLFRQLINAVGYCHDQGVAHRDLKVDNTLLTADDPPRIKLCDFGFACECQAGVVMHDSIGTPVYQAPELLTGEEGWVRYNGKRVDIWACGIMLVVMLLGRFPFDHPDHQNATAAELSDDCRDLLSRMLDVDQEQRITVAGIKEHPWYLMPLTELYEAATAEMEGLQAGYDQQRLERNISEVLREQRRFHLQNMVEAASHPADPMVGAANNPLLRVDLRGDALLALEDPQP